MKTAIIYNSSTGFTKQYAEWLSEKIAGETIPFAEAKDKDFSAYDTIVFGSWCCAGSIQKLKWFKEKEASWTGKKLAVYAVGASPIENPDIKVAFEHAFSEEERAHIGVFYCQGGLRYDAMKGMSHFGMKLFAKMMKNKKNKTDGEEKMAAMIQDSYDCSSPDFLTPLIEYLNA